MVGRVNATGETARLDGVRASVAVPIHVSGRLWGAVAVCSTEVDGLAPDLGKRLADFTSLVAQALANAEAREQLAASAARIVEASDAERRRLERNLHDGAQSRLVALSLALGLAHTRLQSDPAAAERLLAGAREELAVALGELRELARGIHPAVLTQRGLRTALALLAERSPVPVELTAPDEGRLPEPVEGALYYVVSEALANVAKHANATRASLTLTRTATAVTVELADDGEGGADPAGGSGLQGLADRVEALQGRFAVTSEPGGGTRLRAEIPL